MVEAFGCFRHVKFELLVCGHDINLVSLVSEVVMAAEVVTVCKNLSAAVFKVLHLSLAEIFINFACFLFHRNGVL